MRRGLLIDDDPVYLQVLRRSMERRNFEIATALEGESAIELAKKILPDFVLIDMNLGIQSGLDLITPFRQISNSMNIVLVTGYASVATAVEAMKRGADNYLLKPASVTTILRALNGTPMVTDQQSLMMTPLSRVEWEHIQQAMTDTNGNISAAARLLGMHRRTLQRKLASPPSPNSVFDIE